MVMILKKKHEVAKDIHVFKKPETQTKNKKD